MGYLPISNLYKNQEILMFKECYALEKIHGTSAHIEYIASCELHDKVSYFSGGVSEGLFIKLFDRDALLAKFAELGHSNVTVYGEAYGGCCLKMSHTYGEKTKFVAFDVQVGDSWLSVPQAEDVVKKLGLEFVHYVKVPTDLDSLNRERDKDSVQAIRNGIGPGKDSEGVVLRPLIELTKNNGERLIVKHKKEKFQETATERKVVDPALRAVLVEANEVADEWVTEMRLVHVVNKFEENEVSLSTANLYRFIPAMIEDVKRESAGEVIWSKEVEKAIGRKTANLVKSLSSETSPMALVI